MKTLAEEVGKLKEWIERTSSDSSDVLDPEWESMYPGWGAVYKVVERVVLGVPSDKEVELLIYALARDTEAGTVLDLLEEHP